MNLSCYKTLCLYVCVSLPPNPSFFSPPLVLRFPLIFPLLPLPPCLSLSCLLSHPPRSFPSSPSPRPFPGEPRSPKSRHCWHPQHFPGRLLPGTDPNKASQPLTRDGSAACSLPRSHATRPLWAVLLWLLSPTLEPAVTSSANPTRSTPGTTLGGAGATVRDVVPQEHCSGRAGKVAALPSCTACFWEHRAAPRCHQHTST